MPLSDIVSINISTESTSVTRAGFGMPLILSWNADWVERVRTYSSLGDVADDFEETDPEYLGAQAMFSQNPRPPEIAIGRCANAITQAFKVSVASVANSTDYSIRVGDYTATITSDSDATNDEIAEDLATELETLANAASFTAAAAGSASSKYVTITAATAGAFLDVAVVGPNGEGDPSLLLIEQNHSDPGLATDLTAIKNENNEWYGIFCPFNSKAVVTAIAAWAEANDKLYVAQSNDSVIITTAVGGTDVADEMKDAAYARTAVMYHATLSDFADAAWLGKCLPFDPGSETWVFKTLTGVTADTLTSTHQTNLEAKYCNYYYTVAGVSMTSQGKVAANEFIDVVRGRDWYVARLGERMVTLFANAKKVPYTDAGIAMIEKEVRAQNQEGLAVGLIADDPAPSVSVPRASAATDADRAARILRGVTFSWRLAGAIHELDIDGTVTA